MLWHDRVERQMLSARQVVATVISVRDVSPDEVVDGFALDVDATATFDEYLNPPPPAQRSERERVILEALGGGRGR